MENPPAKAGAADNQTRQLPPPLLPPAEADAKKAVTVSASGSAHIYGKDAVVPNLKVEIWSTGFMFVRPQQTFSNQTINDAEQIMKKLVNDWAASQ